MPGDEPQANEVQQEPGAPPDVTELIDDRYQLLHLLGVGGMGRVFKALDRQLERVVAIKLLHPHKMQDRAAVQRLLREAKSLSELRHDNICAIYQVAVSSDGQLYIVSEFVDGKSLRDRLSVERTLPENEALAIFQQVLKALALIHQTGLVHRDITPANILVTADGAVKVIDFGIAKSLAGQAGQKLTATGSIIGTPVYLSPEQLSGTTVDGRSDLFSAGVCLYETLSGQLPWGPADDLVHLYQRQQSEPQPLPAKISARTGGVVRQALSASPLDRFATADGMAQALAGAVPYAVPGRKSNKKISWRRAALAAIPIIVVVAGFFVYQGRLRTDELQEAQYRQQYEAALKEYRWRMRLGKESEAIGYARQATEATRFFPATEKEKLIAQLYLQAVQFGLQPAGPEQIAERDRLVASRRKLLGARESAWLFSNSAWNYFLLSLQAPYAARRTELLEAGENDFKQALIAQTFEPAYEDSLSDLVFYCKSVNKFFERLKDQRRKVAFFDDVARQISDANPDLQRIIHVEQVGSRRELCATLDKDEAARMQVLKETIDLGAKDPSGLFMFEVYREYGQRLFRHGKREEGMKNLKLAAEDVRAYPKGEQERGRLLVGMAALDMERRRPDLAAPEYEEGIAILKKKNWEAANFDRINQALGELVDAYRQLQRPELAKQTMLRLEQSRRRANQSL